MITEDRIFENLMKRMVEKPHYPYKNFIYHMQEVSKPGRSYDSKKKKGVRAVS